MRCGPLHCGYALLAAVMLVAGSAQGQGVTLQLPTLRSFSVATTVVVPDRGGAYMGGVGRVSSGRSRFGPPGGRSQTAFGFEHHAAGLHAAAHIHDLRGMDEALRRGSESRSAASPLTQRLLDAQKDLPRSLEQLDRQRLAEQQAQQAAASDFLRRGRAAQLAGKTSLARTYFEIALRRSTGALRDEIARELQPLQAGGAPRVAAQP
jgi:hypothetical protein